MKTSPTQRSLKKLRSDGYSVGITEHWNSYVGIRQDLYSFVDMIAIKAGCPIVAVQTTTTGNMSKRIEKIRGIKEAETWLLAGGTIQVHGWAKRGARGKRKLWELKVYDYQG
jgi:hypothetical protein